MSNSSSLRSSRANSRSSSVDLGVRDEAAQLEMVRRRLEEEAVDDVAPVGGHGTKLFLLFTMSITIKEPDTQHNSCKQDFEYTLWLRR